jgi:CBS domain-containing protein
MKVGNIMTTGAATVRPDASLAEAARIMVEHRISGLPVVDASGRLVGVITEGDFLRRTKGGSASLDQRAPEWL